VRPMQASAPHACKTSSVYAPCALRRGVASRAKAPAVQSATHVPNRFKLWVITDLRGAVLRTNCAGSEGARVPASGGLATDQFVFFASS
jgi:hypothetical protein